MMGTLSKSAKERGQRRVTGSLFEKAHLFLSQRLCGKQKRVCTIKKKREGWKILTKGSAADVDFRTETEILAGFMKRCRFIFKNKDTAKIIRLSPYSWTDMRRKQNPEKPLMVCRLFHPKTFDSYSFIY